MTPDFLSIDSTGYQGEISALRYYGCVKCMVRVATLNILICPRKQAKTI